MDSEQNTSKLKIYFVYLYLDPTKAGAYIYGEYKFENEPFYVGKGKKRQHKRHLEYTKNGSEKKRNLYKYNKIRKILSAGFEPIIIRYKTSLSESEALELEIKMIAIIGRADKKLGPLCNLTDGGEGTSGHKCSEKGRQKLIEFNKTRKISEHTRKLLSLGSTGRKWTEEMKQKGSLTGKLRWTNPDFRKKMLDIASKIKGARNNKITETHRRQEVRDRCSKSQKERYKNNPKDVQRSKEILTNPETRKKAIEKATEVNRQNGLIEKLAIINRRLYKITSPTGETKLVKGLKAHCRNNKEVSYNCLRNCVRVGHVCARGKNKGWNCEEVT